MKIDSHQHFWKYNAVRDSWIDETMGVIRRNFLPEDLKPVLEGNNIDGCIAIQAEQSEDETHFLLELQEKNPFIKGVVGWVDLCAANIEERLNYFSNYKNLSGFRHIVQAEPIDFMAREDFRNGISKLQQYGWTYDILVFPSQLPAAIDLVQNFPDQSFVLDHIAKPNIKDGTIDSWEKNIKLLAKFSNVHCKISGMVTEAKWNDWSPNDFTKYLDVIFKAFGIERVLYGSDWPVCLLSASYKEQLKIIENYITQFSMHDTQKIMGENASKIYTLS